MRPYSKLILKNFIGISDNDLDEINLIANQWKKINKCNEFSKTQKKYVRSIIKIKNKPDLFYRKINLFNKLLISKQIIILSQIKIIISDLFKLNNTDFKDYIDNLIEKQNLSTYSYLKEINIKINKTIEKSNIIDIIYKDTYADFNYTKIKLVKYQEGNIHIDNNKNLFNKLNESRARLIFARKMIDYIDYKKWGNITGKTLIYRGSLKKRVVPYTTIKVSQALLKMYEILSLFNIFKKNNKKITTMSICEAPGQFIQAINHYLKTKTNNVKYDWYANSLNHLSKEVKKKYGNNIIDDTYGLIKRYPKRWLYGVDNTGDITNLKNIYSIKNV